MIGVILNIYERNFLFLSFLFFSFLWSVVAWDICKILNSNSIDLITRFQFSHVD